MNFTVDREKIRCRVYSDNRDWRIGVLAYWRIGVDWCKGGWFYIASSRGEYRTGVVTKLDKFFELFEKIEKIAIDMPIGLYEEGGSPRPCDTSARQLLSPRGSTIFPAPVRPCLAASDYLQACEISESLTGKQISQQAFHIMGKIKEVDDFLLANPDSRDTFIETHPEVGFCGLNGKPLLSKKKKSDG